MDFISSVSEPPVSARIEMMRFFYCVLGSEYRKGWWITPSPWLQPWLTLWFFVVLFMLFSMSHAVCELHHTVWRYAMSLQGAWPSLEHGWQRQLLHGRSTTRSHLPVGLRKGAIWVRSSTVMLHQFISEKHYNFSNPDKTASITLCKII